MHKKPNKTDSLSYISFEEKQEKYYIVRDSKIGFDMTRTF